MLEAMPVKKLAAGGRPIVRVLPQPIYDAEILAPTAANSNIVFYAKPIGNPDASGLIASKTLEHTNLKQSGSLAKPYEFDLFSFNLKVVAQSYNTNPGTTLGMGAGMVQQDLLKAIQAGYLEFSLGNRVYLDVPIKDVPCGVAVDGYDPANPIVHMGTAHRSNAWKFTVGKFLVHIRSTESFQVTLNWQKPFTPTIAIMAQCFMNGLMYNAI